MRIRVGHLYPDYLNIYADRGNIAVLARRAAWRGHELVVDTVSMGDELVPGAHDLLYVGGGQDREQELVAVDLAAKGERVQEAVAVGAAALAVCGGYQLLGRYYRDRDGTELPGIGGCRVGRAIGTYLHGPLLPRNPWLADWLLAQALAHATGGEPPELEPLPDELEHEAHAVAARRARARGGRFL